MDENDAIVDDVRCSLCSAFSFHFDGVIRIFPSFIALQAESVCSLLPQRVGIFTRVKRHSSGVVSLLLLYYSPTLFENRSLRKTPDLVPEECTLYDISDISALETYRVIRA